ncbi:MAG TPA: VOC family protein [Verrucomicrobiae bacterium]|jgi:glyoxylase I family protein|nr:VOC family protein [Verrucomicrobiae bacterium]
MSEPFTLEHIGLASRDTRALKEWYERTLGAQVVFEMRQEPPAYLIRIGGMLVEIYSAQSSIDQTSNNRLAGWRHIALEVNSIEEGKAFLEKRGVVFPEAIKPAGGGGRVLFFSDPDGNLLHLTERLAGGFQ